LSATTPTAARAGRSPPRRATADAAVDGCGALISTRAPSATRARYRPEPGGAYYYDKGVNPNAIGAFVPSAAITAVIALVPAFKTEAPFSWVIAAVLGSVSYYAITRVRGNGAWVPPSPPCPTSKPTPEPCQPGPPGRRAGGPGPGGP
jgi:hypothetical protein